MISVLIVDDDRTVRETLAGFLAALGHSVRTASSADEGRQLAAEHTPDLVLVDVRLPDSGALGLLDALRRDDPGLGVIMLTGHADVTGAHRAMRRGALDFLEKPVELDALDVVITRAMELVRLRREVVRLRAGRPARPFTTPAVERLIDLAVQNDDVAVLIVGEAGTGKGYVARQIHDRSSRALQPFVELNGASDALASELFGHERGAFADTTQASRGSIDAAGRGTLFLREVGAVAAEVQVPLLEVLVEGTYRRLGSSSQLRSEARLIAATSRHLAVLAAEGRFRADLCDRLQVLTVTLASLRERLAALPALAAALLPHGARLAPSALRAMQRYGWPGNVRELENTLWRASIVAEGAPIEARHLTFFQTAATTAAPATLEETERRAIQAALSFTEGNKVRAARLLGIARSTLLEKLKSIPTE